MRCNYLIFATIFSLIVIDAGGVVAQQRQNQPRAGGQNQQRAAGRAQGGGGGGASAAAANRRVPSQPARAAAVSDEALPAALVLPPTQTQPLPAAPASAHAPRFVIDPSRNQPAVARPPDIASLPFSAINNLNCEFHYQLCMNRFCSDPRVGKCICADDNNLNPGGAGVLAFVNIDGQRVRRGLELFNFAQRRCEYILEQCMDLRRNIVASYRTALQRDCLRLAELESQRDVSLQADFRRLSDCAREWCTAQVGGREDFRRPEFGLCFERTYAQFVMDARCPEVIASSRTPAALRQFFLSHMDTRRGLSCQAMGGRLSSDGQACMVTIDYGPNRENILMSRQFAVGDMVSCSGGDFGVINPVTRDYLLARRHQRMQMVATGVRVSSAVVGMAMSFGAGGAVAAVEAGVSAGVATAIHATTQAVQVAGAALDISEAALGLSDIINDPYMDDNDRRSAILGASKNIGLSALSMGMQVRGLTGTIRGAGALAELADSIQAAQSAHAGVTSALSALEGAQAALYAAQALGEGVEAATAVLEAATAAFQTAAETFETAQVATNVARAAAGGATVAVRTASEITDSGMADGVAGDAVRRVNVVQAASILNVSGQALNYAAEVANLAMQAEIDAYTQQLEREGLVGSVVDRARGGVVADGQLRRGNCFFNNEWIATEGEAFMLFWQL